MSGYIGPLPVPQGIQRKQSFTATASQTTFNTNGYTDGAFINVYLNGVRLINGTDYTATNGSDIVLTTGASASDVLDFETFDTFELVNQTFENVTLKNPTHEDTDGGRESAVSFKGEQSGGEISTLAQIQASHDGTSDDQKGDLIFKTNDGSDNDAPTEAMRIDSSQNVGIGGSPNAKLDVRGGIRLGTTIADVADGGRPILYASDGSGSHTSHALVIQARDGAGSEIDFVTGTTPTTRMHIGSSGNVGIGTSTINRKLEISGNNNGGAKANYIRITDTDTTATADNQIGGIEFFSSDSSGGAGISASIETVYAGSGGGGELTFNINATSGGTLTERARISNDGLLFNGDTAAANALSDYEEGTFTPTLDVTTMGSLGLDTSSNTCSYVKIGKLVTCIGSVGISGSGGSGNLRLTNFPFAMNTGLTEEAELAAVTVNLYNTAVNATGLINGEMSNVSGDATLLIRDHGGQTAGVQAFGDHLDQDTVIRFAAIYRTT